MTNFLKSITLLPNGFKKLFVMSLPFIKLKSLPLKSVLSEQNNFFGNKTLVRMTYF